MDRAKLVLALFLAVGMAGYTVVALILMRTAIAAQDALAGIASAGVPCPDPECRGRVVALAAALMAGIGGAAAAVAGSATLASMLLALLAPGSGATRAWMITVALAACYAAAYASLVATTVAAYGARRLGAHGVPAPADHGYTVAAAMLAAFTATALAAGLTMLLAGKRRPDRCPQTVQHRGTGGT